MQCKQVPCDENQNLSWKREVLWLSRCHSISRLPSLAMRKLEWETPDCREVFGSCDSGGTNTLQMFSKKKQFKLFISLF